MFQSLIQTLLDRGAGLHGYQALVDEAYKKARTAPEAAALYLLAKQAEDFVDFNERMPVPASELEAMFARITNDIRALDEAYSRQDRSAILEKLTAMAQDAAKLRKTLGM